MTKKISSTTPGIRVAQSGVHGLGVFAVKSMRAGTFLGVYEGRRYTAEQMAARTWDDQLTYLFMLSNDETIDGAEGGNATRHLNHSCTPNCEAVEEYDDQGRLHLKLQTIVPVAVGDELFIDYGLVADESAVPSDYPCLCGVDACRGTMLAAPDGQSDAVLQGTPAA